MLQQELFNRCFLKTLQMHTFKQIEDYFFIKIFVKNKQTRVTRATFINTQ